MTEAALAVLIVIGSGMVWVGVPIGGLWLAGELTTTAQGFLFAILLGIPLAMIGLGWLLYRANGAYERLRGGGAAAGGRRSAWLVSYSDERGQARRARAPRTLIDVAMTVSAVTAIVIWLVWFFFFASSPLAPMA
jgi:hypothetical protein